MFDTRPETPEEGLAMGLSLMAAYFELYESLSPEQRAVEDARVALAHRWPEPWFREVTWPRRR